MPFMLLVGSRLSHHCEDEYAWYSLPNTRMHKRSLLACLVVAMQAAQSQQGVLVIRVQYQGLTGCCF